MPKIRFQSHTDTWLKDFGNGVTDHVDNAHVFSDDEAHALCELNAEYSIDGPITRSRLYDKSQPAIPAGRGRVWVRYKNTWLAASKQELFLATRRALEDDNKQLEIA